MIPPFDERGYLPPGVHLTTLEEVADRFGRGSELRRIQAESIRWMMDLARRAGVSRIILNGSFVTEIAEPNDVDCLLLTTAKFPVDAAAEAELIDGLPFLEIEFVDQERWDYFTGTFFATDREGLPKRMIEVTL